MRRRNQTQPVASNPLRDFLTEALNESGRSSWCLEPVVVRSARAGWARIGEDDCLVLCSNDYLGLACDPRVISAAERALHQYGAGSRAARSFGGDTSVHRQLEEELADFKGVEAALLFNSGMTCNMGVIAALMEAGDLICSDELNHASIIDGCRLSRARVEVYRHCDTNHLAELLENTPATGKAMVVSDSVFSMAGAVAPLDKIVELAEQHGVFLMVDDAHATGVLGQHGEGSSAHFGIHGRVDIQMGTLGKALGSVGGFIAGDQELIDYLASRARTFLFSTSLPPAAAAAALEALRILRAEPERVQRLWENVRRLHSGLDSLGFNVLPTASPINPVLFGSEEAAARVSHLLLERSVYVQSVGVPYVPSGTSRLRTIVSASHTNEDIDAALAAFASIGEELGILDQR